MPNSFSFTIPTSMGDAEATFNGTAETGQGDWSISYPWGERKFFGTISQVRKEMEKDISTNDSET